MRRSAQVVVAALLLVQFCYAARIEGKLKRRFEATLWPTKVLLINSETGDVKAVTVEAKQDHFSFDNVGPGMYQLVATGVKCYVGEPEELVVKADKTYKLTLKMRFDPRLCSPITVD